MQSLRLKPSEPFELIPIYISKQHTSNDEQPKDTLIADAANPSVNKGSYREHCTKPQFHSSDTNHQTISVDQKHATASMHNCAMDSYFIDQLKRDREHRSKRSLNQDKRFM